ncbi:hypothetical protein HK097_000692 [Rhizophlyctis rosea]|uniref:Nucleolar protein 12 n=1 Tax=Rhizophlyctis rosea TaxID=64517 RepID=A0AAD5SGD6_9FUNG|nr:hypothetical protein HK097_000692 [Rhizophlyctis rosea]
MKNQKKSKSFRSGRPAARPEEVVYDPSARKDYLTGFQKRNQEKKKKAIEYHKQKEKDERRELRKENNKKSLIINDLEKIEAIQRGDINFNSSDEEDNNSDAEEPIEGDHEEETESSSTNPKPRSKRKTKVSTIPSETKITTVTVMEFDPTQDDLDVPVQRSGTVEDGSKDGARAGREKKTAATMKPAIRKVASGSVTKKKSSGGGGGKKRIGSSRKKVGSRSNGKSKTGKRRP